MPKKSRKLAAPPEPKARRGTQNAKNLEAIIANRKARPRVADLRAQHKTTAGIAARTPRVSSKVVGEFFDEQAAALRAKVTTIEKDYAGRAAKGNATKQAKSQGKADVLKALAGGRDELRAHARNLGIAGRSRMSVPELRSAVAKAAAKVGRLGIVAAPVAAALLAYDAAKSRAAASGLNMGEANVAGGKAAVVAGATAAALMAGIGKGISLASKVPVVSRLLGPAGLVLAAEGAREGFQKHGPPGALVGALGLDDLAALAKHKAEGVLLPPPTERTPYAAPRSADFAKADANYKAMQTAKAKSNAPRGWAHPQVQAAAKAAQGKTYTAR